MERGTIIRTLVKLWAVRKQTLAEWRRFNEIYEIPDPFRRQHRPKGPRWGQPGRGRRRKARFAARKRERQMQEIRAIHVLTLDHRRATR